MAKRGRKPKLIKEVLELEQQQSEQEKVFVPEELKKEVLEEIFQQASQPSLHKKFHKFLGENN